MKEKINVTAGIIYRNDGKVLICRRLMTSTVAAGLWEFPGGKQEPEDWTLKDCLERELFEELQILVRIHSKFTETEYDYGKPKICHLHVFFCSPISGEIKLSEHSEFKWVHINELVNFEFTPTNVPVVLLLIKELGNWQKQP